MELRKSNKGANNKQAIKQSTTKTNSAAEKNSIALRNTQNTQGTKSTRK